MLKLPNEIHKTLSEHLNFEECVTMRMVCHSFNDIYSNYYILDKPIKKFIVKVLHNNEIFIKYKIKKDDILAIFKYSNNLLYNENIVRDACYYNNRNLIEYFYYNNMGYDNDKNNYLIMNAGLNGACESNNELLINEILERIESGFNLKIKINKNKIKGCDFKLSHNRNNNGNYDYFIYRSILNDDLVTARVGTNMDLNYSRSFPYIDNNNINKKCYTEYYKLKDLINKQNMKLKEMYSNSAKTVSQMRCLNIIYEKCKNMGYDLFDNNEVIIDICKYGNSEIIDFMINKTTNRGLINDILYNNDRHDILINIKKSKSEIEKS